MSDILTPREREIYNMLLVLIKLMEGIVDILSVPAFLYTLWRERKVVFNFWYPLGDENSKTFVTKKDELIKGKNVNCVSISGEFAKGNEIITGVYGRPNNSTMETIRKMRAVSFKVMGDGKNYCIRFPTFETMNGDHYLYVFPTMVDEVITVTVNIPDDLMREGWSGKEAEFIQNNIMFLLFQPVEFDSYNLKFWDIKLFKRKAVQRTAAVRKTAAALTNIGIQRY
jgi:hypothetical protein